MPLLKALIGTVIVCALWIEPSAASGSQSTPSSYSTSQPDAASISTTQAEASEPSQGQYHIGPDDILFIKILRPDELEQVVTVAPDGSIAFPYIERIHLGGQTLLEAQNTIQKALSEFMKYPVVSVALQQSRSKSFYVYGEINNPGPYTLQDNTTVLRAIAMAGGLTKFASASKVQIIRERENKKGNEVLHMDLKKAMQGDASQDIPIQGGDVITVSEGWL